MWIFGYSFLIAMALAVIAHVVLFHTRFGTYVLATGGNSEAAAATGVSTARIKIAVYIIAGLTAGIAAILLVARVGAAEPASNTSFLLNSVAAVVLGGVSLFGGRATIAGPVVGALLLTALVNGLTLLGVSQFYQPLSVGIVVVPQPSSRGSRNDSGHRTPPACRGRARRRSAQDRRRHTVLRSGPGAQGCDDARRAAARSPRSSATTAQASRH